ncbi:hypothetical protein [Methylibium sp.]|uniref:hypothetical protein n=1 Tax=Methylibium sp. TaxID=2067992 RepID=UPI003D0F9BD2
MTAMSLIGLTLLALLLALIGGAASGLRIGADALGKELAAMMGAFFGPTAVLPAIMVGLLLLYFVR